jgi:hypothetical protein
MQGVATVGLTAIAIRWLYRGGKDQVPKVRGGSTVYQIKRQWRALGLGGGLFFIVLFIWSWHDLHYPDRVFLAVAVIFTTFGVWLASGSVRTDQAGITKCVLWRSISFHWDEITQISVLNTHGRAIELYAGERKLVLDLRFIALSHLLAEIERQTGLVPLVRD